MTREDVGIVIDFLNLTENEFIVIAFLVPIMFMMWGAAFYFTSRFVFMALQLWKKEGNHDA